MSLPTLNAGEYKARQTRLCVYYYESILLLIFLAEMHDLLIQLRCVEETELATKSEQDTKVLQRAISELQIELRAETKRAKESQHTKAVSYTHLTLPTIYSV